MLYLPKGETIHSGLKTAFTQFDAMLEELHHNEFTGYVRIATGEYDGALLFDTGQVVTAFAEWQGHRSAGSVAALELATKAHGRDGSISVCRLSHEWISILAGASEGASLFGRLGTDLVELGPLIKKLESNHHTGYVHIALHAQAGEGFVLIQNGQLVDSQFTLENGTLAGEGLPGLLKWATACGADIEVFKSDTEKAFLHGNMVAATLDLPRLLEIWQKIIQAVEKSLDAATHKGVFASAFASAVDARTKDYPFMDRTSSFRYEGGNIKYAGKAEADLNRAIGECLSAAIDELAEKHRSMGLRMRAKLSLQSIRQECAESIKEFALENVLYWEMTPYERVLAEAWPFLGSATERIVERQCQEHLGLAPEALKAEHLNDLGHWVEISSTLVISKDQARKLGMRIEGLTHLL